MQRIYQSFNSQAIMQTFGAKLGEVRSGHVEISAPILAGSLQQHGFAHAALIFALGDIAAGYYTVSALAD